MTGREGDQQKAASEGAAPLVLVPDSKFRDRYRVVRCIKSGGMGAVYEVVDGATNSRRALKVMLPTAIVDVDLRDRFAQEAKVTGEIESEHITRVLDAGVDEATQAPFMVMELLRGEDLGAALEKRGALSPVEAVHYAWQAALGLEKTHQAGIVHRDLKPDNLFVTRRDDGSPCVKLLDFGIAKVVQGADPEKATRAMGTPLYMAPEQVRGEGTIGPRTDVYALGHVVYALVAGEAYWRVEKETTDSSFLLMVEIVAGAKEPPSERAKRRKGVDLPRSFDAWFTQATAVKAQDRFPGAMAAVSALAEALEVDLPQPRFADPGYDGGRPPSPIDPAGAREGVQAKSSSDPGKGQSRRSGSISSSQDAHIETTATNAAVATSGPLPAKGRGIRVVAAAAAAILAVAVGAFLLRRPAPDSAAPAATSQPVVTPSLGPATVASSGPVAPSSAPPDPSAQPTVTPATTVSAAPSASASQAPTAAPNAGAPRARPATTAQSLPKKHGIF